MQFEKREVKTSHGVISVETCGQSGPDVVFIHAHRSSRQAFHRQTRNETFRNYRMVSFDLPGHGESEDAQDIARTYSLSGLADVTIELLELMGVHSPVLVGWALGGHVAIEMLRTGFPASALFLTGTSPVDSTTAQGLLRKGSIDQSVPAGMSDEDAVRFVQRIFGASAQPFMQREAQRADGRFCMADLDHGLGEKISQHDVVSQLKVKTAVVNGRDDCVINLDQLDKASFSKLWRETCFRIPGAGHAPFLEAPIAFNALLSAFLAEVAWDVHHLDHTFT